MKITLLSNTNNPEKIVAIAAKTCYSPGTIENLWKSDAEIEKFIKKLHKIGHLSPFEHASFTFSIDGISRACSHQLVRHRVASFSQQSQRYVPFGGNDEEPMDYFVIPTPILNLDSKIVDGYIETLCAEWDFYNIAFEELVKNGLPEKEAAENARYLLPNAAKTNLVMTMNARELMHFFSLRCCNRAQEEIRQLAWTMLHLLQEQFPLLFEDCGPSCLTSKCKEGSMSCGKPYQKGLL